MIAFYRFIDKIIIPVVICVVLFKLYLEALGFVRFHDNLESFLSYRSFADIEEFFHRPIIFTMAKYKVDIFLQYLGFDNAYFTIIQTCGFFINVFALKRWFNFSNRISVYCSFLYLICNPFIWNFAHYDLLGAPFLFGWAAIFHFASNRSWLYKICALLALGLCSFAGLFSIGFLIGFCLFLLVFKGPSQAFRFGIVGLSLFLALEIDFLWFFSSNYDSLLNSRIQGANFWSTFPSLSLRNIHWFLLPILIFLTKNPKAIFIFWSGSILGAVLWLCSLFFAEFGKFSSIIFGIWCLGLSVGWATSRVGSIGLLFVSVLVLVIEISHVGVNGLVSVFDRQKLVAAVEFRHRDAPIFLKGNLLADTRKTARDPVLSYAMFGGLGSGGGYSSFFRQTDLVFLSSVWNLDVDRLGLRDHKWFYPAINYDEVSISFLEIDSRICDDWTSLNRSKLREFDLVWFFSGNFRVDLSCLDVKVLSADVKR